LLTVQMSPQGGLLLVPLELLASQFVFALLLLGHLSSLGLFLLLLVVWVLLFDHVPRAVPERERVEHRV
jgi:hypothetical protein